MLLPFSPFFQRHYTVSLIYELYERCCSFSILSSSKTSPFSQSFSHLDFLSLLLFFALRSGGVKSTFFSRQSCHQNQKLRPSLLNEACKVEIFLPLLHQATAPRNVYEIQFASFKRRLPWAIKSPFHVYFDTNTHLLDGKESSIFFTLHSLVVLNKNRGVEMSPFYPALISYVNWMKLLNVLSKNVDNNWIVENFHWLNIRHNVMESAIDNSP